VFRECTQTREASAGCEGGIRAQCKAKATRRSSATPSATEPSSRRWSKPRSASTADAKLSVQCTPPHMAFKLSAQGGRCPLKRVALPSLAQDVDRRALAGTQSRLKRSSLVNEAGADLAALRWCAQRRGEHAKASPRRYSRWRSVWAGAVSGAVPRSSRHRLVSATLKASVDAAGKINSGAQHLSPRSREHRR